jgi:hypothetical protein
MKTLEVIHLRLTGHDSQELHDLVQATAAQATGLAGILVYRHARIQGDLLIHVPRSEDEEAEEPSDLGLRLASLLRLYGLVEHSVWLSAPIRKYDGM